ncbi:MAG: HTH-type transcriptional regulator CysB [Gammaproteobacteria bacterium]|nr:HTH-type transcriptional regulator CysB [Gammaproteobacteria bacterium]
MKLQQLRYIWEVAHHDLNVSATATELFTSQPGISKQIRLLEEELGIDIFARNGKRLTRVTPAGEIILDKVGGILREVASIRHIADEYRNETRGTLSIATTHTQARYALPDILPGLREAYPEVTLHMRQGTTEQIGEWASSGEVDFAIAPEVMDRYPDLIMMPCYRWNRSVVVPRNHELAHRHSLGFDDLKRYPIVTYDAGFWERLPVAGDSEAEQPENVFDIALSAVDTDVIKTYVRLGFGVGIIARMAYDPEEDKELVAIDASNLFKASTTFIGCRKGTFMRQFMIDFVGAFAPHLTPELIERAFVAPNPAARAAVFDGIDLPER